MFDFISAFFNKIMFRPYISLRLSSCGNNFRLGYSSTVNNPQKIKIGDNFFTGPFGYISTNKNIEIIIGNDVMIGPCCKLIAGNHNIRDVRTTMNLASHNDSDKGILIQNDVWVGASSVLLDGSILSEGCVVGAGALVCGYCPPYSIILGYPPHRILARFSKDEMKIRLNNCDSLYGFEEICELYRKHDVKGW